MGKFITTRSHPRFMIEKKAKKEGKYSHGNENINGIKWQNIPFYDSLKCFLTMPARAN